MTLKPLWLCLVGLIATGLIRGQHDPSLQKCKEAPHWSAEGRDPMRELQGSVVVVALIDLSAPNAEQKMDELRSLSNRMRSDFRGSHVVLVAAWQNEADEVIRWRDILPRDNLILLHEARTNPVHSRLLGRVGDLFVYDRCGKLAFYVPKEQAVYTLHYVVASIWQTFHSDICNCEKPAESQAVAPPRQPPPAPPRRTEPPRREPPRREPYRPRNQLTTPAPWRAHVTQAKDKFDDYDRDYADLFGERENQGKRPVNQRPEPSRPEPARQIDQPDTEVEVEPAISTGRNNDRYQPFIDEEMHREKEAAMADAYPWPNFKERPENCDFNVYTDKKCYDMHQQGQPQHRCCYKGIYATDLCQPEYCGEETYNLCCFQRFQQARYQCCNQPKDKVTCERPDEFSKCCYDLFAAAVSAFSDDPCCPPTVAFEHWTNRSRVVEYCVPDITVDYGELALRGQFMNSNRQTVVLKLGEMKELEYSCPYVQNNPTCDPYYYLP